ncbi:MAG: hypothetical protein QOD07_882 [Frankiaceae bacterium]|jgi:hypothetical protein|nr:hypothetical protein [Frankiaceae bacterium]
MTRTARLLAAAAVVASGALTPLLTVPASPAAATSPAPGTFHPVARAVLADTRTGLDTDQRAMAANESRRFVVAGQAGIPTDSVAAVLVQVVAERPAHATTLQVWDDAHRPHVAAMPAPAARVTMTTVPVGLTRGAIAVTNGATATHIQLVVEGWWSTPDGPPGMQLRPVLPRLVFDQTVKAGSPVSLDVYRTHLVPSTSTLLVTLTATAATSSGTVTLGPSNGPPSGYPADVAVDPGTTATQTSAVQVGPTYEAITIGTTAASVRVRLWITGSGGFPSSAPDAALAVHPVRVFDTLNATSTTPTPVATGAPRVFRLGGMFGVPDDHVGAAVVAVTVYARSAQAAVTVAPTDAVDTDDSPVVALTGYPVQTTRLVRLGTAGRLTVAATGSADVEIDVLGWVTANSMLVPSIQENPPNPPGMDISPSGLLDPVIAPDGETAYAADIGAPVLRRFDLRYGIELTPIALTAPATGIDLLPGGSAVLAVEPAPLTAVRPGDYQTSVRVEHVDLATGALSTVPTPSRLNAVDVVRMSDGTMLYAPPGGRIASDAARTVAWMNSGGYTAGGRWDVTDRTWLYGDIGLASVNDDATVVADGASVMEAPADGPLRSTPVPGGQPCNVLLLSADGATAYCEQGGDLIGIDVASATETSRAPMPDAPSGPYYPLSGAGAVSPDGHTVVVTTDHGLTVTDVG